MAIPAWDLYAYVAQVFHPLRDCGEGIIRWNILGKLCQKYRRSFDLRHFFLLVCRASLMDAQSQAHEHARLNDSRSHRPRPSPKSLEEVARDDCMYLLTRCAYPRWITRRSLACCQVRDIPAVRLRGDVAHGVLHTLYRRHRRPV